MKLINKVTFFLLTLLGTFYYSQSTPPPPVSGKPSDVGPGTPASPIDMYVYVLIIAAISLMSYYHYRTRKNMA